METLRVGFIGCGRHSGLRLYPGLEEAGLELVAICDTDVPKATERARQYGVDHVYTDWRQMCDAQSLEAVLIVTGAEGHFALSKQIMEAGYPVFMEKPAAPSSAQATELAQVSASTGKHAQVGFNYRYAMGTQRAVSLMEQGRFAKPAMVSVRWWLGEPDTARFMLHYAVHAIDLLNYLTPGGLTQVDPADLHVEHVRQEPFDYYMVNTRGKQGTIAVMELASHMTGEGHNGRVDLMSSDGILTIMDYTQVTHYDTAPWGDLRRPDSKVYDGDRLWRTEPLLRRGATWHTYGYVEELSRFREAVHGLRKPEATVADAAWGMRVMDRLLEAAGIPQSAIAAAAIQQKR